MVISEYEKCTLNNFKEQMLKLIPEIISEDNILSLSRLIIKVTAYYD